MATRVPTGAPRGRPKGCVKSGGRVAGKSLDKTERIKITGEMAGSILQVFERLGGVDFLYRWAKKNETAFVNSCLARLMSPMPRDGDGDTTYNTQVNVGNANMGEFEAARRVAFCLSKAAYEGGLIEAEIAPQEAMPRWIPPTDAPDMLPPDPVPDPDRERWASEIPLTPQERADAKLIRQTREASLETYAGSVAEQGGGGQRQPVAVTKRTVNQIRSDQMRNRRDDLL